MIWMLILLTSISTSVNCIQIHNHMTDQEIHSIFQTSRNKVPEYEVVPISHTLHKRSMNESQVLKLNTFGRDIELYLNPTTGLLASEDTSVWTVEPDSSSFSGLKYRNMPNAFKDIGQPFQDIESNSAVILQNSLRGHLNIFGNILTNLIINPLPSRLFKQFFRFKRSLNDTIDSHFFHSNDSDEFAQTHYHVIYKRSELTENEIRNKVGAVNRNRVRINNLSNKRAKRNIPDVIHPEVLVILDYSLFESLGKSYKATILYLLSFWNAVDLRYRTMNSPEIRLHLAGFIISIKEGGTPYLEQHRRRDSDIDADLALTAMSKYFFQEKRFPFDKYDMAIILTKLDLCNMMGDSLCDTSTLGYAYEAGACNRSFIDHNTEAVGLVEDNGGYSAILPTTHEVAHLLGVPHDGMLDTYNCPGYYGYIMTGMVTYGENNFHWSDCSKQAFREFFNSPDGYCLFNEPQTGSPLPRILPGKVKTLDEQCEKVYGTKACYYDDRVCTKLECHVVEDDENCAGVAAAAEGSYCGEDMHCINGHCVSIYGKYIPEPKPFIKPTRPSYWNRPRLPLPDSLMNE